MTLSAVFIDSLAAVPAAAWNAVAGIDHPFTRHEFLYALERSGAAAADSGWSPHHALVRRGGELVAVLPLYLKSHSYGEYVFDWSWADAYRHHRLAYYPKLLSAIPFTPATGPRLCVADGENTAEITELLVHTLRKRVQSDALSSLHILFPEADATARFTQLGLSPRLGAQYHWFNHGFADFDAFLATFNSRKRKNLRKERDRVLEQGLSLRVLQGAEIGERDWRLFHHFYQTTYAKRSGHGGYLNLDFFKAAGSELAEHIVLVLADWRGDTVAGALCFRDDTTLYGRYWGCLREFEFLHFEACYYQGIEYCIREGLQRFDPGAQGEHKIQRGFTPVATHSCHWIEQPQFRAAIDQFLVREQRQVEAYIAEARTLLPFRAELSVGGS